MRFPSWLWTLFAAAFIVYTDDYVISGILPELAADLGVSESQAGQLVTTYSLTVALVAPFAAVAFASVPRRRLLCCGIIIFVCANAFAAAVSTYTLLLALRIVIASSAAAVTPAVFAFAAEQAPGDKTGRYVAIVSLGVTGSIAAGVPMGAWIGGHYGWRACFIAMAAAGVIILCVSFGTLPYEHQSRKAPRLREQLRVLVSGPIAYGLLSNCALMSGSMMMLTYLAPYLSSTSSGGIEERALAFSLSGIAGIVGIWLGGISTDKWGASRTLHFGIVGMTASMVMLWILWGIRPVPISVVVCVVILWGGLAFWNSPAIQARLYMLAGSVAPQALALNTSGTYLGVSIGAAVGGIALHSFGPGSLPLASVCFCLASLVLIEIAGRLWEPEV